jgi:hypothetical protein
MPQHGAPGVRLDLPMQMSRDGVVRHLLSRRLAGMALGRIIGPGERIKQQLTEIASHDRCQLLTRRLDDSRDGRDLHRGPLALPQRLRLQLGPEMEIRFIQAVGHDRPPRTAPSVAGLRA